MVIGVESKQQSPCARTDRQIRPIVNGFLFLLFANLAVKGVLGLNALNTAPQSPTNINGSLFFSFGNQPAPPPTVSQQQIQPQQFPSYQPVVVLNRENSLTTHKPTITIAQEQHVLNSRDQLYDDEDYAFLRSSEGNSKFGAFPYAPNGFYNKKPKYFGVTNMEKSPKKLQNRREDQTQIFSNTIDYLPKVYNSKKLKLPEFKTSQNPKRKTLGVKQVNSNDQTDITSNNIHSLLRDNLYNENLNNFDLNNILSDALQSRRHNFETKIEIASNNIINYLPPTTNQFIYKVKPRKPIVQTNLDQLNVLTNHVDYLTPTSHNEKTRFYPKLSTNTYGRDMTNLQKPADAQMKLPSNVIKLPNVIDFQKYFNSISSDKKTVSMLLNLKQVTPKTGEINNNEISLKQVQDSLPNGLNCRYKTGDTNDVQSNIGDQNASNDRSINRFRRNVKISEELDVDNKHFGEKLPNGATNNLIRRAFKTGKQLDLDSMIDVTPNVTDVLPPGLETFTTESEVTPDEDEFGRQQVTTTTTTSPTITTLPPSTTSATGIVSNVTDSNTTYDLGYGPPNGNDNINITYPDTNNTINAAYGPPNNTNIYGPPNNIYGPPSNAYGPPSNAYGPPSNGAPIVNNVYGPPVFSKPISPGFYPSSSGFYPSFNDKSPYGTFFQKPYGFENKYPTYNPNTFSSFYNQFPSSTKYAFGSGYGYGKPASSYPFNLFRK